MGLFTGLATFGLGGVERERAKMYLRCLSDQGTMKLLNESGGGVGFEKIEEF